MQVLPQDKGLNSNYNGQLPSQKYFTPQELNGLSRVGKGPLPKNRPPSATKPKGMVKNQDLKKVENPQAMTAGGIHSTNFSNPWDEVNAM